MTTKTNTLKDISTTQMSRDEARVLTDKIRENLDALPQFIQRAMLGNAPRALGYDSIAAWAKEEFGLSRSRVYQYSHWQTVLLSLIDGFNLGPEWSLHEEKVRHLNRERYMAMVKAVQAQIAALKDTTEAEREELVKNAIILSYGEYQKELAEKKASSTAAPSKTDIPSAIEDASLDSKASAPQPAVIVPVTVSYELLVVKAKDTASVLSSLTADEVPDSKQTLAKLNDARAVLDSLIAYFTTSVEEVK